MESIPKKSYFAKELALKILLGDQAFSDLKRLLDPCCGIGFDNICTAPCYEPSEVYTLRYETTCDQITGLSTLSVYATPNKTIVGKIGFHLAIDNPNLQLPAGYFAYASTTPTGTAYTYTTALETGLTSGVEILVAKSVNIPSNPTNTQTAFIIDSRGNWSDTIDITIPECPE